MTEPVTSPEYLAWGTEKAPTKNEPAEMACLGAFVRDDSRIAEALAIAPARTWRGKASFLAVEWERRLSTGEPLDPISVATAVSSDYPNSEALLVEAYESVPHAGNVLHHARLIAEANRRYEIRLRTGDFFQAIETQCDIAAEVANLQADLQRLVESTAADDVKQAPEGIASVLEFWESPHCRGLASGFPRLDRFTEGWKKGRLYLLAAATGIGKSAFAANTAWHVARSHSVLFNSLEMPAVEVYERGLCAELRKSRYEIQSAMRAEATADEIADAMSELSQRKMSVDDRSGRNVAQIASQVRRHKRKHGIDLLIVDYLQLITPRDTRVTRNEQLGEVSRGLKLLAMNLDIPVIALSQLSRAGSGDNVRPQLHHLRDSGCLEQDADCVIFIHRQRDDDAAELLVEKNRGGRTGAVSLVWRPEYVRYEEATVLRPEADEFQ